MELGMPDSQNKVIMIINSMIIMINNPSFSLLHITTQKHQGSVKWFLGLRGKIPTKMLRQLIFNFHPKKRQKYPLLGPL